MQTLNLDKIKADFNTLKEKAKLNTKKDEKKEIIETLKNEFLELRKSGVSWSDILKTLKENGIILSVQTLKKYLPANFFNKQLKEIERETTNKSELGCIIFVENLYKQYTNEQRIKLLDKSEKYIESKIIRKAFISHLEKISKDYPAKADTDLNFFEKENIENNENEETQKSTQD